MTVHASDSQEEIEAALEQHVRDESLTKTELKEIAEVSVSVEEAVARANARVEGRRGEDESLVAGDVVDEDQAIEVARADQGDHQHTAARAAEARGDDPGKAIKEAKKDMPDELKP